MCWPESIWTELAMLYACPCSASSLLRSFQSLNTYGNAGVIFNPYSLQKILNLSLWVGAEVGLPFISEPTFLLDELPNANQMYSVSVKRRKGEGSFVLALKQSIHNLSQKAFTSVRTDSKNQFLPSSPPGLPMLHQTHLPAQGSLLSGSDWPHFNESMNISMRITTYLLESVDSLLPQLYKKTW